ncbi:Ficolin-2 [Holothuria leucospilota]|uniref:Ficolin-2 n=1 Tax=Holothuria leucospilota TaxID=206669 RepID=A0A9Q1BVI7_HOLLE|nr:Ficolin-2 [Holothuria leucospilota]
MRQCEWFPNDCYQLRQAGIFDNATFTIQTLDFLYMNVSCDMTTDGGVGRIFQRRFNGAVNFDRGWEEYKEGFGILNLEFWLGNENLHHLTKQKQYTLRIDLITMSGESLRKTYDNFTVDGEVGKYRLVSLGEFDGTPGLIDAMSCHETMNFSTKDNDNDCSEENCAIWTSSGWWFNGGSEKNACPRSWCKHANLNGLYDGRVIFTTELHGTPKWS